MADDAKTVRGRPASTSEAGAPAMPTAPDRGGLPAHAPPAIPPARYILGPEIARGGMGRVVEATDTLLGRVVALKEALSSDPESLERFAREIRITARLEHPSIVPVHDGGKGENGMPFYVMRKIDGRPLERLVAQSASLGDRLRLVRHMVAAAEAIAHAHERLVVHRDIKPSNILVGELGETIVIDWGLAKVIGEEDEPTAIPGAQPGAATGDRRVLKTRAGVVFGTPGFMAPEQLRGGPVDPRWDVYALGATLYFLLSKKPPHHADSADDMMRDAAKGPPAPVGELVQGVPPELATIIDKALAFDPDRRYQDARELAEDLQRFLGGQLVASHHYTTRQKISRYVLQHRYAFIVGAVAAAALMVGGAFAFVGIMNERDRADDNAMEARKAQKAAEEERLVAVRRTEDLSLSSARSLARTNPTFAIALVRPLVEKRWREVRAIAAEARAAGVAWSLPASPRMQSLELSRDGRRALGAGTDGVVRLYDLDARSQRVLAEERAPITAVLAGDEKQAVLWTGARVSILDLAGTGRRDVEVDAPIVSLEIVGTTAYWVDAKQALWQMELSAVAPMQIPLDETVTRLAASPDGRWIALVGTEHVLLYAPGAPTEPPVQVLTGVPHALDWASDGSRLALLHADHALQIATAGVPRLASRVPVGERTHVVASEQRVFTIGPTGIARVGGARPHTPLERPIGLEEARGGVIVAGGEDQLVVLTEHGEHALAAPSGRFSRVRASRSSAHVVAIADQRLLVWNLDELVPRAVGTQIATAKFVTGDDLVATTLSGPAQWIDLATGNQRTLGAWPAILEVTVSPSGRHAAILDMAHAAHLVEAGKPAITIPGPVDRAGFVDDTRLMLATEAGAIEVHDVTTGARTRIHDGGPLASIAWGGLGVLAAHFVEGTLWRKDLRSGELGTIAVPRPPTSNLRVARDGDVFIALGDEIVRWPSGGRELVHHAKLPLAIASLQVVGADSLLALAAGGAAYVVSTAKTDTVTDLEESIGRASVSTVTGLAAVGDRDGIDVIDPSIKPARWRLASGTFADVQLASDGRRVLAKAGSTLLVWDLALPANAVDTAAWLDRMTNAVTGDAKTLGWR